MSDAVMSLQAIRAKLQQLQMQHQQQQHETGNNSSHSHSVSTPMSTQPSNTSLTAELTLVTDKHTSSSLHLTEKSKVSTENHYTGPSVAPQSHLQHQSHILRQPRKLHRHGADSTTETTPTDTFEVQDHKARMTQIETQGNSPEDWKAYIDFLKTVAATGDIRNKPLFEAYSRAFTGILNNREHRNEVSVRLIMDYVQFRCERFEWDSVDTILDMARGHIQSFAIIVVASAEVKILKGDHEKALSILSKALAKGRAQPKELLIRAIKAAEAGQSKLLSEQEHRLEVSWVLGRRDSQDTEDFKVPPQPSGFTDSHIEMATDPVNLSTGSMNTADLPLFTHPSSASKQPLRHYNSTPEVRTSAVKAPWSQLQISKLKGTLGRPMRVRNSVQQHAVHMLSAEKEDDTDFVNSIKPLTSTAHSGRLASMASSGYNSDMTISTEIPIPGQAQNSIHRNRTQSTGPATAEQPVFTEHTDSKQTPVPHHPPPVTVAVPVSQSVAPVMSTPSGKGPQVMPAVMQTPSGEVMETQTVNGEQYCVLKKVGRGGSAQVYMVFDANKNIRALKVVDLEGAGAEMVEGFRNEISLLQRLQYCDSVIKMYNFELNEVLNRLFVVLEFGETDLSGFFSARAKQQEGLDPMDIKYYWMKMLRAVHALHNEGIIHSDLKPANFMLVAGNLKLIDFGIANALQQDKTSVLKDSRVGTPSYMSPEAIMAACDDGDDDSDEKENVARPKYKVGVRSDVWSLGCILYNMVYGRTPFQHIKNNMGKLQAITNASYSIKFPNIPDPLLLDVLKKCLTRDVKSRPTTAELMSHPYLLNKDKGDAKSKASHAEPANVSSMLAAAMASTPGSKPTESRRLQEVIKSQLAQGSPRTVLVALVDLLQGMESGK